MTMRLVLLTLALAMFGVTTAAAEEICGTTTDNLCQVGSGQYRISVPEGVENPGALLWLHGWGGSANGSMKNSRFESSLAERGLAFITADGLITSTKYKNKNWAVNDGRIYERDDIAFLREIVDDAVQNHGIDRNRILLGGFSRGGSMVWDVACKAPDLARAYVPVAGAFWEPMWAGCEAPVDLFHTHGWSDRTVPLEGRPLGSGMMIQGDVFQSLFILRDANGCDNRQPESVALEDESTRWLRTWSDCGSGKQIDLMLHPGGHGIPQGWLNRALNWFEARIAAG
jgi:polyhydroxybutyrate depolymerase